MQLTVKLLTEPQTPEALLAALKGYRDGGLLSVYFPGLTSSDGDPEAEFSDIHAANDQFLASAGPLVSDKILASAASIGFAGADLSRRDLAVLVILRLALKSKATVVAPRGKPDVPLFVGRPWLRDFPRLSGRDRRMMEYVYSWICARHLGTIGQEQFQIAGHERWFYLVAIYFRAVYSGGRHKGVDLYLVHRKRRVRRRWASFAIVMTTIVLVGMAFHTWAGW